VRDFVNKTASGKKPFFNISLQSHKRIIKGEQGDSDQSRCENTTDDETAFVLGALIVQDPAHGQDAHQDQNDDHVHTDYTRFLTMISDLVFRYPLSV